MPMRAGQHVAVGFGDVERAAMVDENGRALRRLERPEDSDGGGIFAMGVWHPLYSLQGPRNLHLAIKSRSVLRNYITRFRTTRQGHRAAADPDRYDLAGTFSADTEIWLGQAVSRDHRHFRSPVGRVRSARLKNFPT